MAISQAANVVEKIVGHGDDASVTTDVSHYDNEYGSKKGDRILATIWQGKNDVKLGLHSSELYQPHEMDTKVYLLICS